MPISFVPQLNNLPGMPASSLPPSPYHSVRRRKRARHPNLASFENSPAARLEMQETALDTMKINDLREIGFVRWKNAERIAHPWSLAISVGQVVVPANSPASGR